MKNHKKNIILHITLYLIVFVICLLCKDVFIEEAAAYDDSKLIGVEIMN